jgi:hypothetical protein
MAAGSSTPQQVRRHGGQAPLFNFDATSRTLLNSYRTPESPLSPFQFQQSLSQYPKWLTAAFQRRLRTSWLKINRFQKSCHRRLRGIGEAHVIRGGLRLWGLAYHLRVRSGFGEMRGKLICQCVGVVFDYSICNTSIRLGRFSSDDRLRGRLSFCQSI